MSFLHGRKKACIDEWQTEMLLKPLRLGNVQLYSTGLQAGDYKNTYVEWVSPLESAVAASVTKHGGRDFAVVPEGPYVILLYRENSSRSNANG